MLSAAMANWQNLQFVASAHRPQAWTAIPELFRSCQREKRENDMKCTATPEHSGRVLRLMEYCHNLQVRSPSALAYTGDREGRTKGPVDPHQAVNLGGDHDHDTGNGIE